MSTWGVTGGKASDALPLYINGQWARSKTGQYQEVRNPATGEAIAQVPRFARDDVARGGPAA